MGSDMLNLHDIAKESTEALREKECCDCSVKASVFLRARIPELLAEIQRLRRELKKYEETQEFHPHPLPEA